MGMSYKPADYVDIPCENSEKAVDFLEQLKNQDEITDFSFNIPPGREDISFEAVFVYEDLEWVCQFYTEKNCDGLSHEIGMENERDMLLIYHWYDTLNDYRHTDSVYKDNLGELVESVLGIEDIQTYESEFLL